MHGGDSDSLQLMEVQQQQHTPLGCHRTVLDPMGLLAQLCIPKACSVQWSNFDPLKKKGLSTFSFGKT